MHSVMVAIGVAAGLVVNSSPLQKNMEELQQAVSKAAKRMKVEAPPVVLVTDYKDHDGVEHKVWIQGIRENDVVSYIIYVKPEFLLTSSKSVLKHAAYHELCHLKNKDFTFGAKTEEQDKLIDIAAEACTYRFMGPLEYMSYVKEFTKDDPNYTHVKWMPIHELQDRLELMYDQAIALTRAPK